jgi:ABC-type antimicrobial peptide transport system permease subunit
VIGIGLVAGLPLGTALGRALYRVFATRLGVLAEAAVSLRSTLLVVAATIVMGLLAAAGPAHRASRVVAAEALRDE